jgi:hypothetical protein
VVLKNAGAFTAYPAAVVVVPHHFVASFIVRDLSADLVWPTGGQSERK